MSTIKTFAFTLTVDVDIDGDLTDAELETEIWSNLDIGSVLIDDEDSDKYALVQSVGLQRIKE